MIAFQQRVLAQYVQLHLGARAQVDVRLEADLSAVTAAPISLDGHACTANALAAIKSITRAVI